jgi:hypothetical protein
MGILPMIITGVPPVSSLLLLPFLSKKKKKKKQSMGKMPMRLTGETPVLRFCACLARVIGTVWR